MSENKMSVMDMENCCNAVTMIKDLMEKNHGHAVTVKKISAITQHLYINQQWPILLCTNEREFPLQKNLMFVVSVGKPSAISLNSLDIREVTQGKSLMDALTVEKPFHISQP